MDSQSSSSQTNMLKVKRTRKRVTKSRNGCVKCKSRRIKCDEKRPSCENCIKLEYPCPGYQQQLRWLNKHQQAGTLAFQETVFEIDEQSHQSLTAVERTREEDTRSAQGQSADFQNAQESSLDEQVSFDNGYDLTWLTEVPMTWNATDDVEIGAENVGEPLWNSFTDLEEAEFFDSQHDLIPATSLSIIQPPAHMPTTLIEYWFQHICPVRSTFDSDINNNRSLARNSWATSEPVFYAMQVMSAVCLSDSMPHLSQSLSSLREQATISINQGISRVRNSRVNEVTADLVFAVLAMGTSSHWVGVVSVDLHWLELCRELLSLWGDNISTADSLLHAYFRQALVYWEMLLTVVGHGSNPSNVEKRRRKYQSRLRRALLLEADPLDFRVDEDPVVSPSLKPLGTLPNSWCGISNEVVETFGQVLALCQSAYENNQPKTNLTLHTTSRALCDLAVAHELENELLRMDFDTIVLLEEVQGFLVDTRDDNTPVSHLLQTAEAYRKAGLLQLYLTFDDLVVNTTGGRAGLNGPDSSKDEESRAKCLVDLALQLTNTLEKIPAASGSKFIHPMLYLSAAVGLKFNKHSDSYGSGIAEGVRNDASDLFLSKSDWSLLDPIQPRLSDSSENLTTFIPQSILKIAEAIRLVWSRLSMIRQALPYKASDSLLRLVKTVWSEYDKASSDTATKHWFKILSQTGIDMPL